MFKITEETLEQEVATFIKNEFLKKKFKCDLITQATPVSLRKKRGGQFDILLLLEKHKIVIELEIGKSWTKFAQGITQANGYKDHLNADGIITIMYPEEVRKIVVSQEEILKVALNFNPRVLILTPFINDHFQEISLFNLIQYLKSKIEEPKPSVSLSLIVHVLRDCVQALSSQLRKEKKVLENCIFDTVGALNLFKIITEHDKDLSNESNDEFRIFASDLSAYILINQLLLYYLLVESLGIPQLDCVSSLKEIKDYFKIVTDIDYKPIYRVQIIKSIPKNAIKDINIAILALKAIKPELVPQDLLGRLLHEFLPLETRKHFGTFYTKPVAAEFLANLSIDDGDEIVLDPACGSGTLLVAAYKAKKSLNPDKEHKQIVEKEIFGVDVMPFASHLTALNLTLQDRVNTTDKTQIGISNSLLLKSGSNIKSLPRQLKMFTEEEIEKLKNDYSYKEIELITISEETNTIIMNPPFTRKERLDEDMKGQFSTAFLRPQNYWAYFLALADSLIKKNGKIAAVLPRDFFKGQFSKEIRKWLFMKAGYSFRYIVKTTQEMAFSEKAAFRDFLVVLEKETNRKFFNVIYLKKKINSLSVNDANELVQRIKLYEDNETFENNEIFMEKIPQDVIKKRHVDLWFIVGFENPINGKIINRFLTISENYFKGKTSLLRNSNFRLIRGIEPNIKNLLNTIFIVRPIEPRRIERSNLILQKERKNDISFSLKGTSIFKSVSRKSLSKGLKTASYIDRISVDSISDYVAIERFRNFKQLEKMFLTERVDFDAVQRQAYKRISNLVISRRINLVAPGTKLIAFFSADGIIPGKAFWSLLCDIETSKILALWLNSTFSLIQIILKRTETGGAWSEFTEEDIYDFIIPNSGFIKEKKGELLRVYKLIEKIKWPSIYDQLKNQYPARKELDKSLLELFGFDKKDIEILLPEVYKALSNELESMKISMSPAEEKKSNQLELIKHLEN